LFVCKIFLAKGGSNKRWRKRERTNGLGVWSVVKSCSSKGKWLQLDTWWPWPEQLGQVLQTSSSCCWFDHKVSSFLLFIIIRTWEGKVKLLTCMMWSYGTFFLLKKRSNYLLYYFLMAMLLFSRYIIHLSSSTFSIIFNFGRCLCCHKIMMQNFIAFNLVVWCHRFLSLSFFLNP
jgi:hypothetical protein